MQPCVQCTAVLSVASQIMEGGYCALCKAFRSAFPEQAYKTDTAMQRFLQMPVAAIRIGTPQSGSAAWFLVEYVEGVDYVSFARFSEAIVTSRSSTDSQSIGLSKAEVKSLLGLACSNRERELIRYSVFKASGLTSTGVRRHFGFEGMYERAQRVECLEEARSLREAIDKLSCVQDSAILVAMGIHDPDSSESDPDTDLEMDSDQNFVSSPSELSCTDLPSFHELSEVLEKGRYNWFVLVEFLEQSSQDTFSDSHLLQSYLEAFYSHVSKLLLTTDQKNLVTTSYAAFQSSLPDASQTRVAALLNGDIVSDSESDSAEDYVGLVLSSERAKGVIARKRKSLARRVRRLKAKTLATRNFLARKTSKHVQTVVDRFPDIGVSIENYVSEANVGADAWRRTGVLTFDGNLRVQQKVTYERIRQYLEEKYQYKFSYGTVVQLCIARNKRRRSSRNYKGVAKVTTRRARKGFELRYNPDKHWSGALYRALNLLQYTEGSDITNINRDDASGFRLDTLTTHSKHGAPTVSGQDILTTYTDYVNRYPSVLQTTSYNLTATKTTKEICVGVVKAAKIYPKNPAQHSADLEMLCQLPALQTVFSNTLTGLSKRIECVRVDGATDEGPSHEEVRFWWAARHLQHGKLVTLLSSRSSGSSYLNRVELQNGCLALGHTNLFIPSTLCGSAFSPETGAIDMDRVRRNLELATSIYIDRVNNSPCGDTAIQLYKGSDSASWQEKREHLLVFLKGSKKKKEQLQRERPELYAHFQTVWDMKKRHEIPGLPAQYLYLLVCCFEQSCPHPICQAGKEGVPFEWFPGGPRLECIPLPVPDPTQPWGSDSCDKCSSFCAGHFLKPEEALKSDAIPMTQPPSAILKDFNNRLGSTNPTDATLEDVAKKTLLPVNEVRMWVDHLRTVDENRKRGALKAAETRRRKRDSQQASAPEAEAAGCSDSVYYCGFCEAVFGDTTEEEYWIGCETCDMWYHGECVNITPENEPNEFYCSNCLSSQ